MRRLRAFHPWRAGAVAAFATTLLVTGCASIPTSGSVHSAEQAAGSDSGIQQQDVQFYPEPPANGASAEQIVHGFLDASGAVEPAVAGQPDFATARKYLASDDPKDWQPGGIQIYDGSPQLTSAKTVTAHGAEQIDFKAVPAGAIDPRGTYAPASPGKEPITYQFDVSEVEGQHRIDNPPSQLYISKSNFDREYESLNLYFFDPSWKFLVPDPLYLAKRADRATLLVRRLLQGPSIWLSSAVVSAFPPGAVLTQQGVRIIGGQAVVDLTRPAGQASRDQLNRFAAQLVRTLAQLQVSSVTVTVEGKPSALTDLEVDKIVTPPPDPDAYVLRDGVLYVLPSIGTDDAREPEKIASRVGSQIKLADFAVQPGSGPGTAATIAGIDNQTRTKLYIAKGVLNPERVELPAGHLESPTWDRSGRLWIIDRRDGRSAIVVVDNKLHSEEVVAKGIVDESLTVTAIAVSEDGTRLALVTKDPDGQSQAQIATVTRIGRVLSLGKLQPLAPGLSSTKDVAWRGPGELVVLGTEQKGQLQPYLVSVDGSQLAPQGTVENPVSVTATRNRPILVGTGSNELWEQSGGGTWERVDQQKIAISHYPG